MNPVLGLATLLLAGFIGGRIVHRFRLPAVTGYILAGLAIGPAALRLLDWPTVQGLHPIVDIALSVIALTIGGELSARHLRRLGKGVLLVAVAESLGAFLVVSIVLALTVFDLPVALVLGAIASATAPAATVAVIREYRAKGPLTQTLLAVVAIDDALCLIYFGLVFSVIKSMGRQQAAPAAILAQSVLDIVLTVAAGILLALVLVQLMKRVHFHRSELLTVLLGLSLLGTGGAIMLHGSPLLLNMALGATLVNASGKSREAFEVLERIETPLFVAFFTLSGADLHLDVLLHVGLAGLLYILARSLGKMAGAWTGATVTRAPVPVRHFLGFGLLPQAGVALGLATLLTREFPEQGASISAIVLGAVVVFELLGPVAAKYGLLQAKEIESELLRGEESPA